MPSILSMGKIVGAYPKNMTREAIAVSEYLGASALLEGYLPLARIILDSTSKSREVSELVTRFGKLELKRSFAGRDTALSESLFEDSTHAANLAIAIIKGDKTMGDEIRRIEGLIQEKIALPKWDDSIGRDAMGVANIEMYNPGFIRQQSKLAAANLEWLRKEATMG
ncbi:MAG: hypothetical protein KGH66_00375 [Candidatus Micrarchaeota archaeon]|nr:hypothetical protein [Candidatus Micrarchaeota archaeon]